MYFWLTCILLGCASVSSAEPINVMTFNIRYGAANDGENSWEYRKDHVIETILNAQPAAIAIQEALVGQITFIEEQLPQYKKVGVHRDGNTQGEFSGLLIDTAKLEILNDGQLWLSATPKEVSKGWDGALARTAIWAEVREVGTSGPSLILFSTHFDHRGKRARLESATLIVTTAYELSKGNQLPVAIMGDFNFTPESAPYQVFNENGFGPAVPTSAGGTFHAFSGKTDGKRIDYIFLNDKWSVQSAEILRPRKDSKSASDHDPVIATLLPKVPTGTIGMSRSIKKEWHPTRDSLVRSLIPTEIANAVAKVEKNITTRPDTEPDFHELSHVLGGFRYPMHLPELAGDLTDRLMVLHCEPSNVQALVASALDVNTKGR